MLTIETSNITSAHTKRHTAMERTIHLQMLQETCLTIEQIKSMQAAAKAVNKQFLGGPNDPEQAKTAAGFGTLATKDLVMYHIPNPTKDYDDAHATGRCHIVTVDVGGVSLTIANIYIWLGGWTTRHQGSCQNRRHHRNSQAAVHVLTTRTQANLRRP